MLLETPPLSTSALAGSNHVPLRVLEVELAKPLPALSACDEKTGRRYRRARCLVRLHTRPLGLVELELGEHGLSAENYAAHIWQQLGGQINAHLQEDGLPGVSALDPTGLPTASMPACQQAREQFAARAPFVSVIVATRNRPERVRLCVQALLALEYPRYEIIIVDNAPTTRATADLIESVYGDVPQVRYIREDHIGGARARNRGIRAAQGEILAMTDDDVIVDRYWLLELVKAFRVADDVACVTGLVLPAELDAPAQFLLEEFGGFSKGFARCIFDMREHRQRGPLYPYAAGRFGTGANMALRAQFLRQSGGFDQALGPGTPAMGGEDLAVLFQVVRGGYKLVYEPAAVLYHPHHRDYAALQKQIYAYGIGLTAYLTKILFDRPLLLFDLSPRLLAGLAYALSSRSPKNSKKSARYPRELNILELKGMLYGPFAYCSSRWKASRARKNEPAVKKEEFGL